MMFKDTLVVIPARGGSKGIPGKNTKPLGGRPLIHYSIDYARQFVPDEQICVSTDHPDIVRVTEDYGVKVNFVRPDVLASDTSGTFEVLVHALAHHLPGRHWDRLVLLQPTSPFRIRKHLEEMVPLLDATTDMVVSVNVSKNNPYFNLFEENGNGLLELSKKTEGITRRQDAPEVYAYNGSIYLMNTGVFSRYTGFAAFKAVRKYVMASEFSVDLDTPADWDYAEYLLAHKTSEHTDS